MDTMTSGSPWFTSVDSEINTLKLSLNKKQVAVYRLDLLQRIARRVDEFSLSCSECEQYKSKISGLVKDISLLVQVRSKDELKRFQQSINELASHLKKSHKLADAGFYIGIGIAIGAGFGAALGAALGSPAFSGIGVGLGVAIGAALDARAKKEGKIL